MSTLTESTTLGELIRQKRTAANGGQGLSRHKLGELTGTSLSSLNRLELKNDVPLAGSLFRIADVLDIDLQYLKELTLAATAAPEVSD